MMDSSRGSNSEYQYLNVLEQEKVISQLMSISRKSPLKDKFCFEYGDYLSCAALLGTSLVFWRSSFRGFGLFLYGKARISTLFLSCTSCFGGAMLHSMLVRSKLTDLYRPENVFLYGIKSVGSHQLGLMLGFAYSCGGCFILAQRSGIIPIPNQMLKRENRPLVYNFFITKLRPYAKTMLSATLFSTIFMFGVGCREFLETEHMLAKINRTSIYKKESKSTSQ